MSSLRKWKWKFSVFIYDNVPAYTLIGREQIDDRKSIEFL